MAFFLTCLIFVIFFYFLIKIYNQKCYFSRLKIPTPSELPIFGIIHLIFYPRRLHVNDLIRHIYDTAPEARYVGGHIFFSPTIFIRDLELVKLLLIKHFDHFADRKTFVDEKVDPLFGQNLNFLNGDRWREVRTVLSPAFTSSKMRTMYVLMSDCAERFTKGFVEMNQFSDGIDIKDAFSRYTNDVIASCAFGIELDSLNEPNNEFYQRAKEVTMFKGTTMLKLMLEMMFPKLTRKFGMRIVSRELTDFFVAIVSQTIEMREKRNITRPDMLQLLMEARNDGTAKFDLIEMTAQAFLFFLAGFEASATQSCIIAHELAVNPDIQKRLQIEVDEVMKASNGKPSYEAISGMVYLDAVISESLRRHPIAFLNRICSKEYELPPAVPGGEPFKVPVGMGIMIPVAGFHADPELYHEPERFEPDRFLGKRAVTADLSNLGFGIGPRMCIGNRFAILEIKALFTYLLASCNLVPSDKTYDPMVYDKNVFAPMPENGFWVKIEKRKG